MRFRSYTVFVRYHKVRMALLMALPFVFLCCSSLFLAWITADMRYSVSLFGLVFMFTILMTITPSENSEWSLQAEPRNHLMPPCHAVDMIVNNLRKRKLLPDSFQVYLSRTNPQTPYAIVDGFERCNIVLSHYDYPLWKQGVAEAIIMHEVGHAAHTVARLSALRPVQKLDKVLRLAVACHLLVLLLTYPERAVTFVAFLGLTSCLVTMLLGKMVQRPLNHSAEFVADSHTAYTCGVQGVKGWLDYFEFGLRAYKNGDGGISPSTSHTHPAPIARIKALRLFVCEHLVQKQAKEMAPPAHA
jgi:Zn-dependent protease with chaperone function